MAEKKNLTDERIEKILDGYYEFIKNDKHARFKSWEHCYSVFAKNQNKTDDETVDLLCLNLAFYLASWGMYRGSSFLLQQDYKIHKEAILEMQKEKYNVLRIENIESANTSDFVLNTAMLENELKNIYGKIKASVDPNKKNNITDTLTTKILLGVFGCIPAYDRYVKSSLKKYEIGTVNYFTPGQIQYFVSFYKNYKEIFDKARNKIATLGIEYPPMKIIDLVLWRIGLEDEGKEKPEDCEDI